MSDSTLLPCHRAGCKGQGHVRDDNVMFIWVQCSVCCLRTGDCDTEAEAIAAWNRRSAPTAAPNVGRMMEIIPALAMIDSSLLPPDLRQIYWDAGQSAMDVGMDFSTALKASVRALVLAALATPEPPLHDPIAHALLQNPD